MRPTLIILVILGMILAACAPAAESPAPPAPSLLPASTATSTLLPATEPTVAVTAEASTPVPVPQVLVTPRGDALEATDPRTVAIGNGQPVLVEFFAFW